MDVSQGRECKQEHGAETLEESCLLVQSQTHISYIKTARLNHPGNGAMHSELDLLIPININTVLLRCAQ